MVVISVLSILIALVLPAVQAAREAARRAQCASNLKQLGIGLLGYNESNLCLPPGRVKSYDPRYAGPNPPCSSTIVDKSLLVAVLPYLEQSQLYNAINQNLTILGAENVTIHAVAIGTFACPSDFASGVVRDLIPGALTSYGVPDHALMVFTSYAGCTGSFMVLAFPMHQNGCRVGAQQIAQNNGCFHDVSPVRLASITDGLSQTIFLAEKSTAQLRYLDFNNSKTSAQHGWYITGNWGDTLVTTF